MGVRISRRRLLKTAVGLGAVAGAGGSLAAVLVREDIPRRLFRKAQPVAGDDPFVSDRVRLQHLLRRATFGVTPDDLARYEGMPMDAVVDDLMAYEDVDDSDLEAMLEANAYDFERPVDMIAWWLTRMTYTKRPLLERMTLFWHGLLTSGLSKVGGDLKPLLVRQNKFLREHALDRYDVILKGISRDPAMMIWLDMHTSTKAHPNENYARELMELFSMGIGNYNEEDVREAARAFTGWSLSRRVGGFVFVPSQHDNGEKVFHDQVGNWDGDDIIDIILRQPAAERYLATRLWTYFAYPDPEAEVIRPVALALKSSGFSVREGLRAVLTSEAFYSPRAYRAIVRPPVDYAMSIVRLLNLETDGRVVAQVCHQMGQDLFNPPNVAGWPGGRAWLGTSTWFARVNAAAIAVNGTGGRGRTSIPAADPLSLVDASPTSAEEAVDALAKILVDGHLSDESRALLIDFARDGVSDWLALSDEERADRMRGLMTLLLASPTYQVA